MMKKIILIFFLCLSFMKGFSVTYTVECLDWELLKITQSTPSAIYYAYKTSIVMGVTEPNLTINFIRRTGLFSTQNYSLVINYTTVTSPTATSASDLRSQILTMISLMPGCTGGSSITGDPTEILYFDNSGNVTSDANAFRTDSVTRIYNYRPGTTLDYVGINWYARNNSGIDNQLYLEVSDSSNSRYSSIGINTNPFILGFHVDNMLVTRARDLKVGADTISFSSQKTNSEYFFPDSNGTGSLTNDGSGNLYWANGGVTWITVTTATYQLENGKGYIVDNDSLSVLTLPVSSTAGDIIYVVGKSADGWKVTQNASQQIFLGSVQTVTGAGSGIESTSAHDCAELVCITDSFAYNVRNTSPNTTLNTFIPFPAPDVLWLDAAIGITDAGGGLVSAWADQSGAGNNATQATSTNQPLLVSGVVNGLPVVRFDGTDNWIECADHTTLDFTTEFTLFIVMNESTVTVNKCFLSKWDYIGQGSWSFQTSGADAAEFYLFIADALGDVGNNISVTSDAVNTSGTFAVFSFVYDGSLSATNRLKTYKDGVLLTDSEIGTIAASLQNSTATLKLAKFGGLNRYWNGDIAEVMGYSTALLSGDRGDVEAYLGNKY